MIYLGATIGIVIIEIIYNDMNKKTRKKKKVLKTMFEHVIRNPFDMKPVFNPCKKPSVQCK